MKESDKIADLFKNRLSKTEMEVKDGFWEQLQKDIESGTLLKGDEAARKKYLGLSPLLFRWSVAASVALLLVGASAAFWCFSPKEEIKNAFSQVSTLSPGASLKGDVAKAEIPSMHKADPTTPNTRGVLPGGKAATSVTTSDDNDSISVRVSITITQRVYGGQQRNGNRYYGNASQNNNNASKEQHTSTDPDISQLSSSGQQNAVVPEAVATSKCNWALKASVGSSLPKGDYKMPFTAALSLEHSFSPRFSIEAGLQYNRLPAEERTLHTLSIPVKLNAILASSRKVDFYALAGAALEKCIAGAEDNSFSAEPIQTSVMAGLGVRYKMSNYLALFAEPSVSHHFDTDSSTRSLHTERPTNLNLLCGVRMTY